MAPHASVHASVPLLAVDIGNSNLKFGIHDGQAWVRSWPVATVRDRTPDEYAVCLRSFLAETDLRTSDVGRVVMSSVVPQLTEGMAQMLARQTRRSVLRLTADLDTGLHIATDDPRAVGTDLLANAVAGYARVGGSCIVVNFGTATTFTVVVGPGSTVGPGRIVGASIAAGLAVTADALVRGAAQLAHVELTSPGSAIGRNTKAAMQSGLVLGHVAMVEGMIARMRAEVGPARVLATGGLAARVAAHTEVIDEVDPTLTLEGLRLVAARNP